MTLEEDIVRVVQTRLRSGRVVIARHRTGRLLRLTPYQLSFTAVPWQEGQVGWSFTGALPPRPIDSVAEGEFITVVTDVAPDGVDEVISVQDLYSP